MTNLNAAIETELNAAIEINAEVNTPEVSETKPEQVEKKERKKKVPPMLFTPEVRKACEDFFMNRGAANTKLFGENSPHALYKGTYSQFITNAGMKDCIKRLGFYNDKFVAVTCPSCFTKFYDDIQKIKNLDCFTGTEVLTWTKAKGKKRPGDAEFFNLTFEGDPIEIIKAIEEALK